MEQEIDTSMNIETPIFKKFKQYLKDKSKFAPNVFNKTPQNLVVLPTVILKETNNIDDLRYKTLNREEVVYDITDTIEIYTQEMILDGIKYSSKEIMNELKYLVFNFFESYGFQRTQATPADYMNYNVDRFIIIETCSLTSWNRKII